MYTGAETLVMEYAYYAVMDVWLARTQQERTKSSRCNSGLLPCMHVHDVVDRTSQAFLFVFGTKVCCWEATHVIPFPARA